MGSNYISLLVKRPLKSCATKPSPQALQMSLRGVIFSRIKRTHLIRRYTFVLTWWRHQMKKKSALLALCAGNSPVTGEFPTQRPVTRSFDVFFGLRLSKQSRGWWFERQSRSVWRHCNENQMTVPIGDAETPSNYGNTPDPRIDTRQRYGQTAPLVARFKGPTWGPSGADRTQEGPMLAPWTLLSGPIPKTTLPIEISVTKWYHTPHSRYYVFVWNAYDDANYDAMKLRSTSFHLNWGIIGIQCKLTEYASHMVIFQ